MLWYFFMEDKKEYKKNMYICSFWKKEEAETINQVAYLQGKMGKDGKEEGRGMDMSHDEGVLSLWVYLFVQFCILKPWQYFLYQKNQQKSTRESVNSPPGNTRHVYDDLWILSLTQSIKWTNAHRKPVALSKMSTDTDVKAQSQTHSLFATFSMVLVMTRWSACVWIFRALERVHTREVKHVLQKVSGIFLPTPFPADGLRTRETNYWCYSDIQPQLHIGIT